MVKKATSPIAVDQIDGMIRGVRVMLDRDLAKIYVVSTKAFNQAVKRNRARFPEDFMFRLTQMEAKALQASRSQILTSSQRKNLLRSQIVTSNQRGGPRYLPYAFTEYGVLMAANILNSPRAVHMNTTCGGRRWMDCIVRLGNGRAIGRARVNIFVVRAFAKMRETLRAASELANKLAALEKKFTSRLDVHEAAIVEVLQELMQILNPPPPPPEPSKPRIGFAP
jgi:hypothetical protein